MYCFKVPLPKCHVLNECRNKTQHEINVGAAGDEPGVEADDKGERKRKENNDTEEGLQRIRSALLYLLWSVECFVGFLELSTKAKFSFQHTKA